QDKNRIRIAREQQSGKRRPERSDDEDTLEPKAEAQPPKQALHFSSDERILKRLEGEEEKAEHQRGGDKGASQREDCQEDEKRSGRRGQREQNPLRLTAVREPAR